MNTSGGLFIYLVKHTKYDGKHFFFFCTNLQVSGGFVILNRMKMLVLFVDDFVLFSLV